MYTFLILIARRNSGGAYERDAIKSSKATSISGESGTNEVVRLVSALSTSKKARKCLILVGKVNGDTVWTGFLSNLIEYQIA